MRPLVGPLLTTMATHLEPTEKTHSSNHICKKSKKHGFLYIYSTSHQGELSAEVQLLRHPDLKGGITPETTEI